MKKDQIKPTESEFQILSIIWEQGPCTVRFINDKLNEEREVGYTTTLKIMQIMTDKGLLTRNTDSRTHIYNTSIVEKKMQKQLLKSFLKTTFRDSAIDLVMQALGNHKTSKEELEEIKLLIEKIEKKK